MTMENRDHMRLNMIEQQIRPWNVLNQRVLNAFDEVNRDEFVAKALKPLAFSEARLPLGGDDLMLFPALEGRILQEVNIAPTDKVLVVGTGSGFLAALAATLGEHVTSIDINDAYTQKAQQVADVKTFAIEKASFDVIILTGSVLNVPNAWIEGLTAGGRLLAFVGMQDQTVTSGIVFQNQLDQIREDSLFEVELERLHGFEDQPQFVF